MTDITLTILVLTIGITALSIMGNKMVQEIKRYHKVKAEFEAREMRRKEILAARKKLAVEG